MASTAASDVDDGVGSPAIDRDGNGQKQSSGPEEQDTPATAAADVQGDRETRQDQHGGSGAADGALDEARDAANETSDGHPAAHQRIATADSLAYSAQVDDQASIAPSRHANDEQKAYEQRQQHAPSHRHHEAKEKLVLEKYTLYKTESVSGVYADQVADCNI